MCRPYIRDFRRECCCVSLLSSTVCGERAKRKGKNKKQVLFEFHFQTNIPHVLSVFFFSQREFISPCETIFRKLQSSIIHVTSQNRTYHQAHTWEIKCCQPFLLLPLSLSLSLVEKCVQEPLNSVKLLPWVGREKAFSQRMSPGFYSVSPHLSRLYCTAEAQLTEMSFL